MVLPKTEALAFFKLIYFPAHFTRTLKGKSVTALSKHLFLWLSYDFCNVCWYLCFLWGIKGFPSAELVYTRVGVQMDNKYFIFVRNASNYLTRLAHKQLWAQWFADSHLVYLVMLSLESKGILKFLIWEWLWTAHICLGELISIISLTGWEIWIIKKGGVCMVQGQVFLKGGRGMWHFSYLIFSRFMIFTFRSYFTLWKIVLCFWGIIIFFCRHDIWKTKKF